MAPQKRILTGIRASGIVHLGNYLGAIKPAIQRQTEGECFLFIANMHALTTNRDPAALKRQTFDLVAAWLACGLDYKNHALYLQSDIPMVTELSWYLSCCIGVGFLEKGHAYKDASANRKEVNHGILYYPILMASDILMYDADVVPVGKDQKQHVEMARDMAGSFNALFGEVLKPPAPHIEESVMVIPGLDGRKMSKSYDNTIPLFCDRNTLRKKVMSIKTDSTPIEEPKFLKGTLVGDLFSCFGTGEEFNDLQKRLEEGGLGWGHAKDELFLVIDREVANLRASYERYRADEAFLRAVTREGSAKAKIVADEVMGRVRDAVGILRE